MDRHEIREVVTEVLDQIGGTDVDAPLLWTVQEATRRTGLPRDELYRLFHAGRISGLRTGPNSRILLKPESVKAFIDHEVETQAQQRASLMKKELAAG